MTGYIVVGVVCWVVGLAVGFVLGVRRANEDDAGRPDEDARRPLHPDRYSGHLFHEDKNDHGRD